MGLFKVEDKLLKQARKQADKVEALREDFQKKSDEELKGLLAHYKERYKNGETLDDMLPEVFAWVREGSRRVLGMEHFYVQLLGGIILHNGDIAEMKTGEGKTLVATLPVCLNAISGNGVHVVTVNEYLAKRDSEWMGKLYKFLGFTVGTIMRDMDADEKQAAYNCDIIYSTNNELGFDYLRDNMAVYKENMVQRELNYAIVDEVDSILIDEARTPLIISGRGDESTELYSRADQFVKRLRFEEDYELDEKQKTSNLTEQGIKKAEQFFHVENFSDMENATLNHHVYQALKANYLMKRDIDYVVKDGEVLIVDEFTGRLMVGRRYSDGLHQAIEAKEGVKVERESKTLATITFQNFFRMYKKLAGMTGTAKTEEDEFEKIYNLSVVQIPTNMPMIRKDLNDVVMPTEEAKFRAVIEEIGEVHKTGQPVLVGTVSVENSEKLSGMLKKRGIPHQVLNAKHHEKEAMIVAQAGKLGAVTIATNMAGRGTDTMLGGNADFLARSEMRRQGYEDDMIEEATGHADTDDAEILAARKVYNDLYRKYKTETDREHDEVVKAGGLYIIGTERHESRRIDNQLRGRSGRQGDAGSSKFYVALEDDLMRLFGGERIKAMLDRFSGGEDIPLEYGMMTKQIEKAQKRIEERNFEMRSHVLQYDDVMNTQRGLIYEQRRRVLMGEDIEATILDMLDQVVADITATYCPGGVFPEEWDIEGLKKQLGKLTKKALRLFDDVALEDLTPEGAIKLVQEQARSAYAQKCAEMEKEGVDMREVERVILLRNVDEKWMDHIDEMDQLRDGIGLRAYGQTDPVVAFRKESFDIFDMMTMSIREDTLNMLFGVSVRSKVERKQTMQPTDARHGGEEKPKTVRRTEKKVGRNDPCPCGSGKKYKNCCGK